MTRARGGAHAAEADRLSRSLRRAFLGFFKPIAVTRQGEDLRSVHETIHQGDNAGRVREDLVPFSERFVRCQDNGTVELVVARNHLK